MLDALLSLIAPHLCINCGAHGAILCVNCKYDIELEGLSRCLLCQQTLYRRQCTNSLCKLRDITQFVGTQREGLLSEVISDYKFKPSRAHSFILADILAEQAPYFPDRTVVVPVPTSNVHIRQRGFAHMERLAGEFAEKRRYQTANLLTRMHNQRQVGSTRAERFKHAASAFRCSNRLLATTPYLLIDDVTTTGATLQYGYEALHRAGARNITILALCQQALY